MNTTRRTDFKSSAAQRPVPDDGCRAFTLIELLVVLFILGILAVLLRPALAGSQQETKSFQCLGNMRQITRAWILYAQDNHDVLADNHDVADYGQYSPPRPPGTPCWCEGMLDWSTSSDNTNILGLIGAANSLLGSYVRNQVNIFHCPADTYLSPAQRARGWTNRCRSIAMDGNVGPGQRWVFGWQSAPWTNAVTTMSGFTNLGPSMSWVFIDEHPDWIDDGQFIIYPAETNGLGEFTELPASYHNNGCGISFADGHAEIHKWLDNRDSGPAFYVHYVYHWTSVTIVGTPSPDLAWLAQHTPY
jgi:prepilin-type N-terminal cleavage/methylation domain-containing protein/prepilin-type processing-associated H-X9-DG protein